MLQQKSTLCSVGLLALPALVLGRGGYMLKPSTSYLCASQLRLTSQRQCEDAARVLGLGTPRVVENIATQLSRPPGCYLENLDAGCDYVRKTVPQKDTLQCWDGSSCNWCPWPDGDGWDCCTRAGGRKLCPRTFQCRNSAERTYGVMCAQPNVAAGNEDYQCLSVSKCTSYGGTRPCQDTRGVWWNPYLASSQLGARYNDDYICLEPPTTAPTASPVTEPSDAPTAVPSTAPSASPTTALPSAVPSNIPSAAPTRAPSVAPASTQPSAGPTSSPSVHPSLARPSPQPPLPPPSPPFTAPSAPPTSPSRRPTPGPYQQPSSPPSDPQQRTSAPIRRGGRLPWRLPTLVPSVVPSAAPSEQTPPPREDLLSLGSERGPVATGFLSVALLSGAGLAVTTLEIAMSVQCSDVYFQNLPPALHPSGVILGASGELGCLSCAVALPLGLWAIGVAAVQLLGRAAGADRDGVVRHVRERGSFARRWVPKAVPNCDTVDLYGLLYQPAWPVQVWFFLFQGAAYSAFHLFIEATHGGSGQRAAGFGAAVLLLVSTVAAVRTVRAATASDPAAALGSTIGTNADEGVFSAPSTSELAARGIAVARVRPWDLATTPPQWQQALFLGRCGDWVSRSPENHWVRRWTVVRRFRQQRAAEGLGVEIAAMLLLGLFFSLPTRSWAACGAVRSAGAGVSVAQLTHSLARRPYRCPSVEVAQALQLLLLAAVHGLLAGHFFNHSEGGTDAAIALLQVATVVVLLRVAASATTTALLLRGQWRSKLQREEWRDFLSEEKGLEHIELAPAEDSRPSTAAADEPLAPDPQAQLHLQQSDLRRSSGLITALFCPSPPGSFARAPNGSGTPEAGSRVARAPGSCSPLPAIRADGRSVDCGDSKGSTAEQRGLLDRQPWMMVTSLSSLMDTERQQQSATEPASAPDKSPTVSDGSEPERAGPPQRGRTPTTVSTQPPAPVPQSAMSEGANSLERQKRAAKFRLSSGPSLLGIAAIRSSVSQTDPDLGRVSPGPAQPLSLQRRGTARLVGPQAERGLRGRSDTWRGTVPLGPSQPTAQQSSPTFPLIRPGTRVLSGPVSLSGATPPRRRRPTYGHMAASLLPATASQQAVSSSYSGPTAPVQL
eukprot:TRINITY_DN11188_c0_g1_i2.p1 TRINITY_DN11188_c0_g1~~TRINITY_DN11188_c0_g1_i2.p1  ORF type:complete len:1143 (+),score=138.63 TRINITY_DN11188_c0_g1_i2:74-3430(+)